MKKGDTGGGETDYVEDEGVTRLAREEYCIKFIRWFPWKWNETLEKGEGKGKDGKDKEKEKRRIMKYQKRSGAPDLKHREANFRHLKCAGYRDLREIRKDRVTVTIRDEDKDRVQERSLIKIAIVKWIVIWIDYDTVAEEGGPLFGFVQIPRGMKGYGEGEGGGKERVGVGNADLPEMETCFAQNKLTPVIEASIADWAIYRTNNAG
ncbi:hypothetical protein KSS87_005392 [Heliosperma pusillum]|nr:hypothetical protein KSS87_005392 [Heliosperma pusillum]